MTTDYTIEPAWLEDAERHRNSYDKVRAVREMTAHCPCDRCVAKDTCRVTRRECAAFKQWVQSGCAGG
ncbi:MAG: hypothetical protein WBN08_20615 [Thiogranum sp.]